MGRQDDFGSDKARELGRFVCIHISKCSIDARQQDVWPHCDRRSKLLRPVSSVPSVVDPNAAEIEYDAQRIGSERSMIGVNAGDAAAADFDRFTFLQEMTTIIRDAHGCEALHTFNGSHKVGLS